MIWRPKINSGLFLVSAIVLSSHWFIVMLHNFSWAVGASLKVSDRDQLLKFLNLKLYIESKY